MRIDGVIEVESKFSDFAEIRGIATGLTSASSSLSESGRTEIDDSDNDSGFVGVSRKSLDRLDNETLDEGRSVDGNTKPGSRAEKTCDRELILRRLASSDQRKRFSEFSNGSKYRDESGVEDNDEEENEKSIVEELQESLHAIPDSLLHLLRGAGRPGDCGQSLDQKPDWLDEEKLRRGQKFAQDYMFAVLFGQLLSLFALFVFEDGLKPLIITGKSSTSYTAFKRYLSTGLRVRNWYTQDLWAEESKAWKDIKTVRAMHAAVRRRLEVSTKEEIDAAARIQNPFCPGREILLEDFVENCEAQAAGQCPFTSRWSSWKGINQMDMAITQWGFLGLLICYPKQFGVHYAMDEDLEAFCHLWRCIGYQLGIEDEFNFCRGTLEEIRGRSLDYIEKWFKPNLQTIKPEWEHMMRSVFIGSEVLFPGADFESCLLYLTEILDIKMPRLYASLSYKAWIQYNIRKYIINYAVKFPGMTNLLNNMMNRAQNRGQEFTPEMFEAIRIKLQNCPTNGPSKKEETVY